MSIADQALTDEKEARSAVEDSTGDAKGAANAAIARSVALSWPAQFSPLSNHAVDGCIPSDLALGERDDIEEERRLLYVAMTRAKDSVHLVTPQRVFVLQPSATLREHGR